MSTRIEVGQPAVQLGLQKVEHLAEKLQGMEALYKEIALVLDSRVQMRFDLKRDPDNVPWATWAKTTEAKRKRKGFTAPANILQLHSPGMRDTVKHTWGDGFAALEIGADYAKYHEQLTEGKDVIPRRAMLYSVAGGLGEGDAAAINSAVLDFFEI